jgi:hypothetical protein
MNSNVRSQLQRAAKILRQVADGSYSRRLETYRDSEDARANDPLIALAESLEAMVRLEKRRRREADNRAATRKTTN